MDIITVGYALAVAAGGLIGYLKAGSTASLAAGLSFGSIIGLGSYLVSINQPVGHYVIFGAAGVLTVFMGNRFLNSGKFFPAGFVTLLSVLIICKKIYERL